MTGRTAEENKVKSVHITKNLFCDWQEGKLKGKEEIGFLEHIGACTFCAEQFGTWMEEGIFGQEPYPERIEENPGQELRAGRMKENQEQEPYPERIEENPGEKSAPGAEAKSLLAEPPKYLKEEILARTRQMDVQASVKLKETSRQTQLFLYSLKVGLAVMASIFLLVLTADIQNMNLEPAENQQVQQLQEKRRETRERKESRDTERSISYRLRQGSSWVTSLLNDVSSGIFRVEIEE